MVSLKVLEIYDRLKGALGMANDINEAREAYNELENEENAKQCMVMACKDLNEGGAVVKFLKSTAKYTEDTPIALQNINFQKIEDEMKIDPEILFGDEVKIYEPKKKVIDLTKYKENSKIGKGEIKND